MASDDALQDADEDDDGRRDRRHEELVATDRKIRRMPRDVDQLDADEEHDGGEDGGRACTAAAS